MPSRPTNRRAAAAMLRSAEGAATGPAGKPGAPASEHLTGAVPGSDLAATDPAGSQPRFDSLVDYPDRADPSAVDLPIPDADSDQIEDEALSRKLDATSAEPGVYLLKDKHGKVLYVGKAKSLRPRVRSYFRDGGDGRFQVRFLMRPRARFRHAGRAQ